MFAHREMTNAEEFGVSSFVFDWELQSAAKALIDMWRFVAVADFLLFPNPQNLWQFL